MGDSGTVAFEVERAGEISRHEVDIDEWQSDRRQVDPFASLGNVQGYAAGVPGGARVGDAPGAPSVTRLRSGSQP